ncbi:MAG: EamA family transporter [Anaerolineaceae bacterium]|nr:EamA family transporter [Anaerolineaceae bacterium]
MGIFWGLLSALGFGSADFIARDASVKLTPYRALFYIHFVSAVALLVVILFDGIPATATWASVGLGMLLGSINTIGTLLLYRALTIGKISIASPVTSAFGGVALLLSLLAGDHIPFGGVLSLLLMLFGIVIISSVSHDPNDASRKGLKGLPEAVIAAIAIGLNSWGLQFIVGPLGSYLPTLIGRVMTMILLSLFARPLHQSVALPAGGLWKILAAAGLITTVGEVAYNIGVQGTTPGIVAVLTSLFSAVTVFLALIFLKERLAQRQWVGVGIVFVATLLIGYFQNFGG